MTKEQLFTDLSDEQAEKVVGGVGAGGFPGAGAKGWSGGQGAPFTPDARGLTQAARSSGQAFFPTAIDTGSGNEVYGPGG